MSEVRISAVFADPRGKYTHGGEHREHCFVIYSPGKTAHVIRRDSEQEANVARGEAVQRLDELNGTQARTAKPKVRPRQPVTGSER
jgi:hypothetical protein